MMPLLEKPDNTPFWLHEESGAFFVLEGAINIYHSKIGPNDEPLGKRTFLFQMLEGELLLTIGLAPHQKEDGECVALLAIPACDSVLNRAKAALSDAMRPFAEEWVEKCCQRVGYSREHIEEACANLNQVGLEGFNSSLISLLDTQVTEETRRTETANRRRYTEENIYISTAVNKLRSVVPGIKDSDMPIGLDDGPLVAACAAVAKKNGIEIVIPRDVKEGTAVDNIVESIASASHFRTREVILSGNWQRQDSGNLLAWLEDGNTPVALLQKSPRRYIMYNPTTGGRVPVTKSIANTISPKAVMFYRSLPKHSLTGKDIFRFVLEGTGKANWAWVFVIGLMGGLLGMLTPQITGMVFDSVIPDGNRDLLLQVGFLMGAMALTSFAFEITRAFTMHRIYGVAERDLQSAVWDRLLSLPVVFFKKYSAGELSEKAMGISQIQQTLSGTVTNTIISSMFSVFYIIVMFINSVRLAWFGLLIALVVMAVSIALGLHQIKYEGRLLNVENKISGRMFGWLSGLSKIKMAGAEKRTFYNWAQMYKESRDITFRKENIGNWSSVWNSSVVLISSIIIYVLIFRLRGDIIGTGAFIAFNAALGNLLQSCIRISDAVIEANIVIPLYKEAQPIFQTLPEYDDMKSEAPPLTGEIELSRINFSYEKDGPQILKDVTLQIRSGEHVAIVGPSGSGKSTLFRILLAFEQPDGGEIYFDKISLGQLNVRSVRRQLGVVLQSGMLLAGSIFENIAGSNPGITHDDAMLAIKQAGMEDDLAQMPMGLHTMVSEGAGTLSGGQRQRLLIARALVGNPKILFFDEATSALDNKTQKIVSDSVNRLKITRVTIAHRLSTVQDCDRIIVLESGSITEEGTYDELMKLNGTFASMARRQMA